MQIGTEYKPKTLRVILCPVANKTPNGTGLTERAIAYFQKHQPTRVTLCSQAGEGGQQSKRQLRQWLAENGVGGGHGRGVAGLRGL